MPESTPSLPEVRCGALEDYFNRKRAAPETSKTPYHGRKTSPIGIKTRGRRPRTNPTESPPQPPPSRKPGSSIYYGVRFRPDLSKWVAEIRVAEWKAVDKKVWLGTFDTEKGAARGVDLARKLLKCKKKHGFNLPCPKLDAYQGQIPNHLILTDVTASNMFKSATLFIKRECQEYAASFHDSPNSPTPSLTTPDLHNPELHNSNSALNTINHIPSQANSFDSEIIDEVGNETSDSDHESSMMAEFYPDSMISINDYLNEYSSGPSSFDQTSTIQSQLDTSTPSSCTSTTSCITFDQQMCVHYVADQWAMSSGPSSLIDAGCIMSSRIMQGGVQCGIQGDMQGPVSQEYWAEPCTWPGPGSSSSASLAPLPGSYYDMAPYMSYVGDTSMDLDDLSFPNYPFPNGSTKW